MSYKRNSDGSYTTWRLMKFDGQLLEATAETLENAQKLLKQEVDAWKNYSLVETGEEYYSPGLPGKKGYVMARDTLVEIIKKEKENE